MGEIKMPLPQVDTEAYNKTIQAGFKKYPQREENYKKYLLNPRSINLDYMPIKMDIEPINRCNLRCTMCLIPMLDSQQAADDLMLEDFKRLIDDQYGVYEIKIQGIGETFLHKDFIKMVQFASEKYIWTRTATNAVIIDQNEYYKAIVDAGIGEMLLSIDGTTKETYEKIRVNSNFERVVKNAKLINNYCNKVGIDKTRMWAVLQKENFHELYNFVPFAKELGFKRLTLTINLGFVGDKTLQEINRPKDISKTITQDNVDRLLELADRAEIDLTFWYITTKYTKDNLCPWPFERAFISCDKYICPCCTITNTKAVNFGQAEHFSEIWFSELYRNFRAAHKEGNIPHECRFCYKKDGLTEK
ncbi:MAG: radical SAM protein [Nitrospirae bacterium]|nr:radical SAM protein [Nitrospirota bacterium]MBF0519247.1 radical SAM protein [Nitrospirota bacterium]MBF0535779.1 radical SAM protein [Nitrospirota bacterium]MBF0617680.1 radical SAM protein [Nitrospirota bacterium]